jgi:hypothetical protein
LYNDAVHRNFFARPDEDQVPHDHLIHFDFDFLALADDTRGLGAQAHQLLERFGRAALGARFEELAEHDEGDDGRARFKVDVLGGDEPQHDGDAVQVRHRRAHRDRHVHVRATARSDLNCPQYCQPVELNERAAIIMSHIAVEHRNQAQVAAHAQNHQRHGKDEAEDQQTALAAHLVRASLGLHVFHLLRLARLHHVITGFADDRRQFCNARRSGTYSSAHARCHS